ncbi:hypothetical protein GCM10020331_008050 [Ectobacillus funiculus]
MSYRKDIEDISLTAESQAMNSQSTQLLFRKKGVLVRPPFVSMPTKVGFVQSTNYQDGLKLFGELRSLNTVEVSLIHHAIETNLVGMQLMIGFAQVATDKEVQDYFCQRDETFRKDRNFSR